ncbi:MAG: sulfite exporter TauE/SafE family protein [Betaproteobacteria bacterium]|nr:sulfite exporter TauE/SafE family protein [Betaproteobacteria bacterium]
MISTWLVWPWWLAYLGIGCAVGFAAGLLGIGGGVITVPLLVLAFKAQGFPEAHILHLALGTSLGAIVFTSVSSVRAHHSYAAVDWGIARAMSPGIMAGSFAAALIAGLIPTRPLAIMFTVLAFYAATQTFFDLRPKSTRPLPGWPGLFTAGATIGAVSSLLSAGGAFLSIPFLAWCGVPLRRAIGTAAANGFPIALAGSAGYILQGLRATQLPPGSLGFVYVPALALLVATSMLTAPLGAALAHRLPVKRLRIVFALFLYAMALRMLAGIW